MRIQGTDGIRRPTAPDNAPRLVGLSPLDAFLKEGVITPTFLQLYAYSFVENMRKMGRFSDGQQIVVGWDPRDMTGQFVGAFITGLRKAGANVLSVGILPRRPFPCTCFTVARPERR